MWLSYTASQQLSLLVSYGWYFLAYLAFQWLAHHLHFHYYKSTDYFTKTCKFTCLWVWPAVKSLIVLKHKHISLKISVHWMEMKICYHLLIKTPLQSSFISRPLCVHLVCCLGIYSRFWLYMNTASEHKSTIDNVRLSYSSSQVHLVPSTRGSTCGLRWARVTLRSPY